MRHRFWFVLHFLVFTGAIVAEDLWYTYSLHTAQVGYSRVSYDFHAREGVYYKKKYKFKKVQEQSEAEEVSAVLTKEYAAVSGYFSFESAQSKDFLVITAGEWITLQRTGEVRKLPKETFHLEIADFLKGLAGQGLSYGKRYNGRVLSADMKNLVSCQAVYLGEKKTEVHLKEIPSHAFKVTTDEFRNFWAEARIDKDGDLLCYELGNVKVISVPPGCALEVRQHLPPVQTLFVFDAEEIDRMYLQFPTVCSFVQDGPFQKVKNNRVLLKSQAKPRPDISFEKLASQSRYLNFCKDVPGLPSSLIRYSREARGNAGNPLSVVENIAQWVSRNLVVQTTPAGEEVRKAFGMSKYAQSLASVSLCRANGIPARVVSGLHYLPGKFVFMSWAEVYLGQWIPLHQGVLGGGARFLTIFQDTTWARVEKIPDIPVSIYGLHLKGQSISAEKITSYLDVKGNMIRDFLLGFSVERPEDWVLTSKDPQGDMLVFRSLKGKGPAILLQVFALPRPLQEILDSVSQKIGTSGVTLLWKQNRRWPSGQGMEIALKSQIGDVIYRVFVGEGRKKGVLALLIVPENELMQVEKGFQSLISSVRFL